MPRTIEVRVGSDEADEILERVQKMDGVVGLARQRGASIRPPGDILTIQTTNDASRAVMLVLRDLGAAEGGGLIQTGAPRSLVSRPHQREIDEETNETTWNEMASLLRSDTNNSQNYLATMFLAGAISAVGLWTDTLHVIVASMVIASAFEPVVRISFGIVAGPRSLVSSGIASTVAGYALLALGGASALLILRSMDPSAASELASRRWVQYWTHVPATGVLVAIFAGAAGTFIVIGQRSVLSTGVMIALALIPSMSIAGMGLASGDLPLAGQGLLRWAANAGVILAVSGMVIAVKKAVLHRQRALE